MKHFFLGLSFLFSASSFSAEVSGIADLHVHLAAHIPYGFMLQGGTPEDSPPNEMSSDHAFHQQMYAPWLRASEIKLFVNATLASVFSLSREAARKEILEQLRYSEQFLKQEKGLSLARSPEEARTLIDQGEIVFVHALEGADGLIESADDAEFWAKQGVAVIGPIHLINIPYGEASLLEGAKSILNWKALCKRLFGNSPEGLTAKGKDAIGHLRDVGIIVDTAHMSSLSLRDTLSLLQDVPVIMSHGGLKAIRDDERSLSDDELKAIYKNDGLIALTGAKDLLTPLGPRPPDHCPQTLEDFSLHAKHFYTVLPGRPVAFGSDFNGFVNHFGPDCRGGTQGHGKTGLTHPGALPEMWRELELKAQSVSPFKGSAEAFLTIWERVRAQSKNQRSAQKKT
jgi:microsomal dipeptidase-like Zn-dependent dipeptidase